MSARIQNSNFAKEKEMEVERTEYIWAQERLELIQLAAAQQLEVMGLPVPRGDAYPEPQECESVFGSSLSTHPTYPYIWKDYTFNLPRVFVVLVEFLEDHVCDEGLFRKAGSVSRQRAIRDLLDCPTPSLPPDSNPHDVASILKQLLRQLPHPLFPTHYWPLLERCVTAVPVDKQAKCLQLCCLLLPIMQLQCLCVVMRLLSQVSRGAGHSLMDAGNLAVVMAPNLLPSVANSLSIHENPLKIQTMVVKTLITCADELGVVPEEVAMASNRLGAESRCVPMTRSLENMLRDGREGNHKEKKQRTSSLSGLFVGLGNRLKRRRGATGTSRDSLPRPAKRSKLEPSNEPKRHAFDIREGVSYGPMLTPLLMGRGFRKERTGPEMKGPIQAFPPLEAVVDEEDHTPDHTHPPPTPLLRGHLHAAKLRHSKSQAGDNSAPNTAVSTSNTAVSTSDDPLPSQPDAPVMTTTNLNSSLPNVQSLNSTAVHWTNETWSSPAHHMGSSTPVRSGGESCDGGGVGEEGDVFGALVRREGGVDSPNLLDKIHSEMVRRHRSKLQTSASSGLLTAQTSASSGLQNIQASSSSGLLTARTFASSSLQIARAQTSASSGQLTTQTSASSLHTAPRLRVQSVEDRTEPPSQEESSFSCVAVGDVSLSKRQSSQLSHYSATLGMDFGDLPRRKLRGVARERGDDNGPPSSPSLHAASLGITLPRGEGRRKRGRGRGHAHKENLDQSHDLTMTPPPILKILESNVKRARIPKPLPPINTSEPGKDQNFEHLERRTLSKPLSPVVDPPTVKSTIEKSLGPLCPLTTANQPGPTPQCPVTTIQATPLTTKHPSSSTMQRFKSPWRWASLGGRSLSYTPIKDKGSVSKRAQPYLVDMPRPSLPRYRKGGVALKRSVSSYTASDSGPSSQVAMGTHPMPPLNLEEWVV